MRVRGTAFYCFFKDAHIVRFSDAPPLCGNGSELTSAAPICLQLAVRMDTSDLSRLAATHGRQLLSQSVVGRFSTAEGVPHEQGAAGTEPSRAKRSRKAQQLPNWSDDLLAQRL